jgi:hypothetical protein
MYLCVCARKKKRTRLKWKHCVCVCLCGFVFIRKRGKEICRWCLGVFKKREEEESVRVRVSE